MKHEVEFTTGPRGELIAVCSCLWSHIETGVLAARRSAEAAERHIREAVTRR